MFLIARDAASVHLINYYTEFLHALAIAPTYINHICTQPHKDRFGTLRGGEYCHVEHFKMNFLFLDHVICIIEKFVDRRP